MEWNTENLEYYSSFWSIFLNSIRVFRKSWYSENIQDYREKLYSSSIRVPKKVDIQKISRNTEKNCIRVVLRSTDVFSGTKRKKKNVLTDVRGGGCGGYNIPLLYRVFITIISFKKWLENSEVMFLKNLIQKVKKKNTVMTPLFVVTSIDLRCRTLWLWTEVNSTY